MFEITGGEMSTVHRLMSLAEEQQALQKELFAKGIFETFLAAFRSEVAAQLKSTTDSFQKQIQRLKASEQEITEALSGAEDKSVVLNKELIQLQETLENERQKTDSAVERSPSHP